MLTEFENTPSLLSVYVAELRDVKIQTDRMRFRRNLERIGELMAYEISKKLLWQPGSVTTPLGVSKFFRLKEQPVLATILRAGLPLHQGLLNYFDGADNAFISAYRKHHKDGGFEIKLEYLSCASIAGKVLIVADPMLATGQSMVQTLQQLFIQGIPSETHVVCAIASRPGIEHLEKELPGLHIWAAAVDDEINSKSYIVPGLGDAGDLAFGEKVQA